MNKNIIVSSVECEVEFDYEPPCRGARERGTGFPLEPDTPENVEINSIYIEGQDITHIVKDSFIEAATEEILTLLAEDHAADYEDYCDNKREEQRDRELGL